jgi:hypothetical protein
LFENQLYIFCGSLLVCAGIVIAPGLSASRLLGVSLSTAATT